MKIMTQYQLQNMTKFDKIKLLINLVHVYNRAKTELNSYTKINQIYRRNDNGEKKKDYPI